MSSGGSTVPTLFLRFCEVLLFGLLTFRQKENHENVNLVRFSTVTVNINTMTTR